MEKVVKIVKKSVDQDREDLKFWLSRPPEERIAAVEFLRRQMYDIAPRIQRVVTIVQRHHEK